MGEKRIAGQNRCRFVKGLMHGRPAMAQIVVVHCRQVVVNERVDVHAFDRGSGAAKRPTIDTEEAAALNDEERTQPLAASEDGIAHRCHQLALRTDRGRQQDVEFRFDERLGLAQRDFDRSCHHG